MVHLRFCTQPWLALSSISSANGMLLAVALLLSVAPLFQCITTSARANQEYDMDVDVICQPNLSHFIINITISENCIISFYLCMLVDTMGFDVVIFFIFIIIRTFPFFYVCNIIDFAFRFCLDLVFWWHLFLAPFTIFITISVLV